MPKAKVYVTIPESVREFVQETAAVGRIVSVDADNEFFVVEIENDDLFDLGAEINEFHHTINTFGDFTMKVDHVEREQD